MADAAADPAGTAADPAGTAADPAGTAAAHAPVDNKADRVGTPDHLGTAVPAGTTDYAVAGPAGTHPRPGASARHAPEGAAAEPEDGHRTTAHCRSHGWRP